MQLRWTLPVIGVLFTAAVSGQQAAADNIERTLQITRTTATLDFEELVTLIRTLSLIKDVTSDPVQRTVVLRAPADQVAIADWLVSKLDTPAGGLPKGPQEYHLDGGRDNLLRLFPVTNSGSVQGFQEMATAVRTMSDLRSVFTLDTPRIVGVRGSTAQIAMAEWMFQELDQPPAEAHVPHEYFVPDSANDVIRVIYFPRTMTVQEFQETATAIRKATQIRRAFTYNTTRALAVRGTIAQIAEATRMAAK